MRALTTVFAVAGRAEAGLAYDSCDLRPELSGGSREELDGDCVAGLRVTRGLAGKRRDLPLVQRF